VSTEAHEHATTSQALGNTGRLSVTRPTVRSMGEFLTGSHNPLQVSAVTFAVLWSITSLVSAARAVYLRRLPYTKTPKIFDHFVSVANRAGLTGTDALNFAERMLKVLYDNPDLRQTDDPQLVQIVDPPEARGKTGAPPQYSRPPPGTDPPAPEP
jgi:hypothetical protein